MNRSILFAVSAWLLPAALSVGFDTGVLLGALALPLAAWGGARYAAALEVTGLSPRAASTLGALFGSFAGLASVLFAAGGCCGSTR